MSVHHSLMRGLMRNFVLVALLLVISGGNLAAFDGTAKVSNLEELRRQRTKAAHRRRRIMFNNDGDDAVYNLGKEATPEGFLSARTARLVGTHVDTVLYCTWQVGFNYCIHNTRVGEIFTNTQAPFSQNTTKKFIEQGTDALKITVDFCRKNNIEVFWSKRMNDTHDAWRFEGAHLLFPQLKKDHPEYLVSSRGKRSGLGGWTAVDYGRPEIRDLAFRHIQEVCENYDVDGVELDFFRHLVNFRSQAWGRDVGQEERDMMTDELMRRIRKMTEEVGLKRGRAILVSVRVPDSVGYCTAIGLDIERWMKEDLIDMMAVSGYFRLNPWEVSIQLGHKHGVPVYPCLSESRMGGKHGKVRNSMPCYRARAMNVWDSGADGVYMFNFFDVQSPLWRELGDPKVLETVDKVYCTGVRSVDADGPNTWLANGKRFLNRSVLSPERPMPLRPGEMVTVELHVGEDVCTTRHPSLVAEVRLQLQVQNLPNVADLSVRLNNKPLADGTKSDDSLEYSVNAALVKKGVNRFEVTLHQNSAAQPTLRDLLLWVRKRPREP